MSFSNKSPDNTPKVIYQKIKQNRNIKYECPISVKIGKFQNNIGIGTKKKN